MMRKRRNKGRKDSVHSFIFHHLPVPAEKKEAGGRDSLETLEEEEGGREREGKEKQSKCSILLLLHSYRDS